MDITIPEIITELHSCGLSKTEIGNVLNLTSQAVTMIHQGKRSGEKHRAKLQLLLDQQREKYKVLSVYETEKTEQTLEHAIQKTEWEIAHDQGQDRILELRETRKSLKEWKQELQEAVRVLGKSYPRGYQPSGNEQEQEVIARAHEKKLQIAYARQNIAMRISELNQRFVSERVIPQEQKTQILGHGFPMISSSQQWGLLSQSLAPRALPSPKSQAPSYHCAKCGEDVRQSGTYRTGPDGRNYHTHCYSA